MPKHLKLPDNFKNKPGAYAKRVNHLAKLLPQEKRQQVLDLAHKSHTIAVIAEVADIEVELVVAILNMNLDRRTHTFLRKESI